MSSEGTTWFKKSTRKLAAVIAGAAILAGAAGVAVAEDSIVDASASRSVVVVESSDAVAVDAVVKVDPAGDAGASDSDKEAIRKYSPEIIKLGDWGNFARSTWS